MAPLYLTKPAKLMAQAGWSLLGNTAEQLIGGVHNAIKTTLTGYTEDGKYVPGLITNMISGITGIPTALIAGVGNVV